MILNRCMLSSTTQYYHCIPIRWETSRQPRQGERSVLPQYWPITAQYYHCIVLTNENLVRTERSVTQNIVFLNYGRRGIRSYFSTFENLFLYSILNFHAWYHTLVEIINSTFKVLNILLMRVNASPLLPSSGNSTGRSLSRSVKNIYQIWKHYWKFAFGVSTLNYNEMLMSRK